MIGIDTNILVRFFVRDNERQTAVATRYLAERSETDPAFVSAVVVCELVWVLEKSYGYSDAAIHNALASLFESSNIVVERTDLVDRAIAEAREAKADISDCIIAAIAADAGVEKTVTFDKPAAKRIPGMELLT
jgi:predicted nucleic-acid-binding protein